MFGVLVCHLGGKRGDVGKVCLHAVGGDKQKAETFKDFRLFQPGVDSGTRTHDIQNHNLTL